MSTNVLVIPEDFRKDQYVLKPIIQRMVEAAGLPKARVRVCQDLLGGIAEATRWQRLERIVDRYRGMTALFLLIVDRDGRPGRRKSLDRLEEQAAALLGEATTFLAENAWQEVEVWVLAGLRDLPAAWSWQEVRREVNPKERYFSVHAATRGLSRSAYEGRELLAKEAAANYSRIRRLCPEDVGNLEVRIRRSAGGTA